MKIGLYFGSFNPIHVGHLIIASYVVNNTELQQVWLVVSPQNPLKPSSVLLNEYDRLHLARLATEGDLQVKVSDIEFKLNKPSYTIDTLMFMQNKYPQHQFSIIIGSDSFQNLPKWKSFDLLVKNYEFIIYQRIGHSIDDTYGARVQLLNAPLLNISATMIRQNIKGGKSIRYLIPDKAREEIETYGYYK